MLTFWLVWFMSFVILVVSTVMLLFGLASGLQMFYSFLFFSLNCVIVDLLQALFAKVGNSK